MITLPNWMGVFGHEARSARSNKQNEKNTNRTRSRTIMLPLSFIQIYTGSLVFTLSHHYEPPVFFGNLSPSFYSFLAVQRNNIQFLLLLLLFCVHLRCQCFLSTHKLYVAVYTYILGMSV